MQPRPAAEACFEQYEAHAAFGLVADKADALRLQPGLPQADKKICQPLRLVHEKEPAAPRERAGRGRAELCQRAAAFAARNGKRVLCACAAALQGIIGRIGDDAVVAARSNFGVRLPQIEAR